MGKIHRAINLVMALALVVTGGAGLVYFYFISDTWSPWLAAAAGLVGFAGLYWLWDEHINACGARFDDIGCRRSAGPRPSLGRSGAEVGRSSRFSPPATWRKAMRARADM
jgi:hypothetical protein